jgi:lysophospholipase L1-like esterase
MSDRQTRREFVAAAGALAAAGCWARGVQPAPVPGPAVPTAGLQTPPPLTPAPLASVVVFQGDSITDAERRRTVMEPNVPIGLGAGYPLLIASAALEAEPARELRFYNRGVSGDKVPDLAARWAQDTLALAPDILSVLVGVNDFWHRKLNGYSGTVADFETGYGQLLESTVRARPGIRLVILEPFVLRCGVVDASWFPEFDERRGAAQRVAARVGATFVPLHFAFAAKAAVSTPEHWAADGVHPTPAGHALIAEKWRGAVKL